MTDAQSRAGFQAMRGIFKIEDVQRALQRAGVPNDDLNRETQDLLGYFASSGTVRLRDDGKWQRT